MSDEVDPKDPYIAAWKEQFTSLMRDKLREMIKALKVTGWDSMAHVFKDPYDDGLFRLVYEQGEFYLINVSNPDDGILQIDIDVLLNP